MEDGFHASALKPEIKAADASEERCESHLHRSFMAKPRASKGLLVEPMVTPTESAERRATWLEAARAGFVTPHPVNKIYYSIILEALWPEGHGIPGPVLDEDDIRAVIDKYRADRGKKPYKDVFRRLRELQGDEGFTSIRKEGTRYQLQSLEVSQKREPRVKVSDAEWKAIKERYGYRCANCGGKEPDVILSPDHRIPRIRHGSNDPGNIQPLCEQCNNAKSNACPGCTLNCHTCAWAFPDQYKPLMVDDSNKELIRRVAEKEGLPQSDVLNSILRDHFIKGKA